MTAMASARSELNAARALAMAGDGMTLAEIAAETGQSSAAVRLMLFRRGKKAVAEFEQNARQRAMSMRPAEAVEYLLGCLEVIAGPMLADAHPVDEWPVQFTKSERRIMAVLYDAQGAVVTQDALWRAVYFDNFGDCPDLKIVAVFVCKIRTKLPATLGRIKTHWGYGFSFAANQERKIPVDNP